MNNVVLTAGGRKAKSESHGNAITPVLDESCVLRALRTRRAATYTGIRRLWPHHRTPFLPVRTYQVVGRTCNEGGTNQRTHTPDRIFQNPVRPVAPPSNRSTVTGHLLGMQSTIEIDMLRKLANGRGGHTDLTSGSDQTGPVARIIGFIWRHVSVSLTLLPPSIEHAQKTTSPKALSLSFRYTYPVGTPDRIRMERCRCVPSSSSPDATAAGNGWQSLVMSRTLSNHPHQQ